MKIILTRGVVLKRCFDNRKNPMMQSSDQVVISDLGFQCVLIPEIVDISVRSEESAYDFTVNHWQETMCVKISNMLRTVRCFPKILGDNLQGGRNKRMDKEAKESFIHSLGSGITTQLRSQRNGVDISGLIKQTVSDYLPEEFSRYHISVYMVIDDHGARSESDNDWIRWIDQFHKNQLLIDS